MDFAVGIQDKPGDLIALFERSFANSEGEEEGRVIGALVQNLISTTPPKDLFVYSASEAGTFIGVIVFTRIRFSEDERTVFMLSPVAVAPDRQGEGIGQALLNFGLDGLRALGVDIALTYGAPAYYAKVGFQQITDADAYPPFPLSRPEGWLGQSLGEALLEPLQGKSRCAPAFDDPKYW
ncbi:MAG: N-acetyltransferase [Pseudomonadota bacterium]